VLSDLGFLFIDISPLAFLLLGFSVFVSYLCGVGLI
jgi:hypothetical protein